MLTLKHSAFLAQLLMDDVNLGESTHGGSQMSLEVRYLALNPHPTTCPFLYTVYRISSRVVSAKAEGIERRTRLDLLKRTWKTSIWSKEDDDEMTLPDPDVPLVYSLHYARQGRQDWEDELPPETMGRMKKQEKGKRNLHAEEYFVEKLVRMDLDLCLSKLIQKYQEVFGALPPPLSCKKLVQMDLKLKREFEGSVVSQRPYPAPQDQIDEIECQIQECIDAALVEEYEHGDYPRHCRPCFLTC